jgi:hypothetical protein
LSRVANFGAYKSKMKNILMHKMLWYLVSLHLTRVIVEDSRVKVYCDAPILANAKSTHEYTNFAIPLLTLSQFQALAWD